MAEQQDLSPQGSSSQQHNRWSWKLFLVYDIFMMLIIVINLFCLGVNALLMSNFATWLFELLQLQALLDFYRTDLHPWVIITESWFISFLVAELLLRWLVAIIYRHHRRWFFFPFVHWYEILAIVPYLRFLRLIRAGVIAYRLQELGYQVVPAKLLKRLNFYYRVVMEELSDRVVITVLDSIKKELDTSSTHKKIIHDLVNHHRDMFATTLAQVLQESLATELQRQQQHISQSVGQVVVQAIENTPQLTQLLRLIPLVGGRIEQQVQSIAQQLGENITSGLIQPLSSGNKQQPNAIFQEVSEKISQINIENPALEQLVESAVYESLESLRKQVAVKQWQIEMEQHQSVKQ